MLLFALLAWVRTLFNRQRFAAELGPITGPVYTLFAFFMVTDPKTIVTGRVRQPGVLLLIARLECALRMAVEMELLSGDSPLAIAPAMYALFILGAPFSWLDLRAQRNARASLSYAPAT